MFRRRLTTNLHSQYHSPAPTYYTIRAFQTQVSVVQCVPTARHWCIASEPRGFPDIELQLPFITGPPRTSSEATWMPPSTSTSCSVLSSSSTSPTPSHLDVKIRNRPVKHIRSEERRVGKECRS